MGTRIEVGKPVQKLLKSFRFSFLSVFFCFFVFKSCETRVCRGRNGKARTELKDV